MYRRDGNFDGIEDRPREERRRKRRSIGAVALATGGLGSICLADILAARSMLEKLGQPSTFIEIERCALAFGMLLLALAWGFYLCEEAPRSENVGWALSLMSLLIVLGLMLFPGGILSLADPLLPAQG